ncbi:MAG: cytochrome C [Saprospiraceae bacterium]|nr:cytochrome C [Saprospiraceae bacterium]MBK7738238.1 cytochrome C [Saprospiraceae bacterium]MBK7913188.1 cytochrome C [Saprospiraceae bacterium]
MKTILNVLKWLGLTLLLLVIGFFTYVQFNSNKTFTAPYPNIIASSDSAVIARGKYLAYGPAHCGTCHVPMDKYMDVEKGDLMPLSGGWELSIPPGTFRAPNITPDKETGIGNLTDGEIARTLRYMVGYDNRFIAPFMSFHDLTDEDLTAIVSFLKSQAPVKHQVKRSEINFLGKALVAFNLIKPEGTKGNPPKSIIRDTSISYGKYLANSVADCVGCHTNRDMKTGELIGKPFAGGMYYEADAFSDGVAFISPNLTPHPTTGIISDWGENAFVARFRAGRVHKGSPMPWGSFSRMDDLDLKAIYRYLNSLDPVENKIEKTVILPTVSASN